VGEMSRLPNPRAITARDYLVYLQSRLAPPNFLTKRKHVSQAMLQEFAESVLRSRGQKTGKEFERLRAQLLGILRKRQRTAVPSPYEDPFVRSLLTDLVRAVQRVCRTSALRLPPGDFAFGVLPTSEVNAVVIRVPSGRGAVVAVDLGTFLFIHLMAKAISSFIPYKGMKIGRPTFSLDRTEVDSRFQANESGRRRFLELVVAYLLFGSPFSAPQYFQRGYQDNIASLLRHTAEMFIVAHEYAHLILGHIKIQKNARTRLLKKNLRVIDVSVHRWKQELLADNLALQIVVAHNQRGGLPLPLAYWGVDFFFSAIDIIDRASGIGESRTHPSARIRRHLIRYWTRKNHSRGRDAVELGKLTEHIFSLLWRKYGRKIKRLPGERS
jgi:hypothetical protein